MRRVHVEVAAIFAIVVAGMWVTIKAEDFALIIVAATIAVPILMGLVLMFRRSSGYSRVDKKKLL